MTPEELIDKLVHAGPMASGYAKPVHWWVYLGDWAIDNYLRTPEEAQEEAERWRLQLKNYLGRKKS